MGILGTNGSTGLTPKTREKCGRSFMWENSWTKTNFLAMASTCATHNQSGDGFAGHIRIVNDSFTVNGHIMTRIDAPKMA